MAKSGMIHKISIKDFVTYSDVEMYPGHNLNIVIGPNGTGKSTIVAAIILGLGGTPKTIGRGTKVSEYVKHDCSKATIHIELFDTNPNNIVTVTRTFNLNNHNTWYINDKQVNEQDVKKTVSNLNIQVNNLCQFLPQDRVQDFAKMDKKELLVNTQKAVGRQDLVDKHAELITVRNEQREMGNFIEQLTTKLNQAKDDMSRLEGKVQNLQEKRKIKVEIDCIKRKICWENYDKYLKNKETVEKDKKRAEILVSKNKKRIQPVENKIKGLKNSVTAIQSELLEARNNLRILENKAKKLLEKSEDVDNQHRGIIVEMRSKLRSLAEFQTEIDTMKAKIDKLVNDENCLVNQYGEGAAIDGKAEKLRQSGNVYQTKCDEMNRQRMTGLNVLHRKEAEFTSLQEKLQAMENIKERRMQILHRRDRDAYEAVQWLRQNKNMFRGNVCEPVMVEVNVLDPKNSKYLENIIPMRDRVAFTCEYREDMNLFLRTVCDSLKLRVNVVHSGAEHPPLSSYKSNVPIEQLRKFGFFAYMSSLISGPEPVVKYLCKMYHLHNIPIGDKTTNNMASQVPSQVRLFFSDCHRYAVSASRYTGQKSTRMSNVESDGTFSVSVDMNSMNQIRRQLDEFQEDFDKIKEKIHEFEEQKQAYENKREEIMRERTNVLQQKEQIKGLRNKRMAEQTKLDSYLRNHKTAEQIKAESGENIKDLIKNSTKIHNSLFAAISELDAGLRDEALLSISLGLQHDQITNLENEIGDLRSEYASCMRTYNEINAVYATAVKDVSEALRAGKRISEGCTPADAGFDKFREKHESLPCDTDELNALVCEMQTKIDCILTADDGELKQYEQGQQMINLSQDELATKERKMNEYVSKIERMHKGWMEPLQDVVSKINKNFGEYFESMNCSGEVSVSHDAPDDYTSYGLSIRVTYRTAEPLQELNRYVQSGGERAVATAVYMLSMQDLSAAPFRCVDEINQGMDPQNERRIFEILVAVAGRRGTGQYFLITPKLIAGLEFGESMIVHMVHNGPFCQIGKDFRFKHLLNKKE